MIRVGAKGMKRPDVSARNRATNTERFSRPAVERFELLTIRSEGKSCDIWSGYCDKDGYGQFSFQGRMRPAHRVAWFLHYGRWPDPNALHTCDNPGCVKIGHLFEGDAKDNHDDMIAKGRQRIPFKENA